jgi:hypothetical protein
MVFSDVRYAYAMMYGTGALYAAYGFILTQRQSIWRSVYVLVFHTLCAMILVAKYVV